MCSLSPSSLWTGSPLFTRQQDIDNLGGFGGREQPTWTQNLLGCISKNTSAHANQKSLSTDAPLSNISIPMKHPSRTGYDWDAAAAAPHPKVNHAHSQRRITRFSLGSRTIETRVHHAPQQGKEVQLHHFKRKPRTSIRKTHSPPQEFSSTSRHLEIKALRAVIEWAQSTLESNYMTTMGFFSFEGRDFFQRSREEILFFWDYFAETKRGFLGLRRRAYGEILFFQGTKRGL